MANIPGCCLSPITLSQAVCRADNARKIMHVTLEEFMGDPSELCRTGTEAEGEGWRKWRGSLEYSRQTTQ